MPRGYRPLSAILSTNNVDHSWDKSPSMRRLPGEIPGAGDTRGATPEGRLLRALAFAAVYARAVMGRCLCG